MIQAFQGQMGAVRERLNADGIGFRHFFLDDGAPNLPDEASILVRHPKNLGLATTTVHGYQAALTSLKTPADVVIKLDCQEHDPQKIIEAVDHLQHTDVVALYFPVVYWVAGAPRKLMVEATRLMDRLRSALDPPDADTLKAIYNQEFPLGYQCYHADALRTILPSLERVLESYQAKYGKPATWGLDLVGMIFAAKAFPNQLDFIFGGWSQPWKENRGVDKIQQQKDRVDTMLDLLAAEEAKQAPADITARSN